MTSQNDNIWQGAYKIPWDEPDFSRRMLAEHLSQEHDAASRRTEWIEKQVAWIHRELLHGQSSTILDLGCGPGLYSHRLTERGHRCQGIDFSPASIAYAQQHNPDISRTSFLLGDIRSAAFGEPYDLVILLFGELNVFAPFEVSAILSKVWVCLCPQGRLIVEMQTPEAVERVGRSEPYEYKVQSGLFSDRPHHCRCENQWLADQKVALSTFRVAETDGGQTLVYRSTTQAWTDAELMDVFTHAGFHGMVRCKEWPCNDDGFALWAAGKR
jgi:SAM-dependent methyltransferase